MEYWFGSSINRAFFPLQENEPFALPVQNPSVFLFSNQPSLADSLSGTGSFQTKSAWTQSTVAPFKCSYSLDPIAPPAGAATTLGFWESIKLVAASGGQAQSVIRYFEVARPDGSDSDPETTRGDVVAVYPGILTYIKEDQLDDFLADARAELKTELEARGLTWSSIGELSRLRKVLAHKAISLASFSQFQQINDRHYIRWKEYDAKYKGLLNDTNLKVDTDGDGKAEAKAAPVYGYAVVSK